MLALPVSPVPREEMLQEVAVQGSDKAAVPREDTLQEVAVQGSDKAAATAHTQQSKRTIKRRGQRKRAADRRARPTVVLKPAALEKSKGKGKGKGADKGTGKGHRATPRVVLTAAARTTTTSVRSRPQRSSGGADYSRLAEDVWECQDKRLACAPIETMCSQRKRHRLQ